MPEDDGLRRTPCGRPQPAMVRCECAETPFAEIGRRLALGRRLDELQVETGVGLICTACLPDLRAYLVSPPPLAAANEACRGEEREPAA